MLKLQHWTPQKSNPKFINYDMKTDDRDKVSVHITESWNAEDTGNVMIDFVIQTERGKIEETIYIPNVAFKELVKIQRQAKVSKK